MSYLVPRSSSNFRKQNDKDSLRWFLSIRGKVAFGLLLVLAAASFLPGMPIGGFLGIALVDSLFLVFNWYYIYLIDRTPNSRMLGIIRTLQVVMDVSVSTAIVYVAGGVLTPMFIGYMMGILVSIVLLDPKGVYRSAGLAILQYCVLAALEGMHLIPVIRAPWGSLDFQVQADATTYALYVLVVTSMLAAGAYMANRIALTINARNDRIESQLQELRILYDVTAGLGSTMDENVMLRYLVDALNRIEDASMCLVLLINENNTVEVKAASGVQPEDIKKLNTKRTGRPEFESFVLRGEPIIVEDVQTDPLYSSMKLGKDTRTSYVFPIKTDSKIIGAIVLSFDHIKPISNEYRDLLTTIGTQAGVAIQRAQLLRASQRMALEMSTLFDVALHTGSTLLPNEVLKRTASSIEKISSPDTYYIALYDEETGAISFEVFVEHGEPLPYITTHLTEGGLTARIIQTQSPLLVQDWHEDGEPYSETVRQMGAVMRSYLGVPMMTQGRVTGVISVQCTGPMAFTAQDERLLLALAAQTAMALENARLHERTEYQSKLDSMTQVYNHGYFVDRVRDAVSKASRDNSTVSLIMMDIDLFKRYNDLYGHVAGDNVLKMVAQVVKNSVKAGDCVGRWGGEEFGVLLPGASMEEARRVAVRIRHALEEITPTDGQGSSIPRPTISQGVSAYPHPSYSSNQLIEQADAALYHAKHSGRNQLILCEPDGTMTPVFATSPLHIDDIF